jgi:hypothetical protein
VASAARNIATASRTAWRARAPSVSTEYSVNAVTRWSGVRGAMVSRAHRTYAGPASTDRIVPSAISPESRSAFSLTAATWIGSGPGGG